jgi:beta-lactamase superfamily II metal-dependent hydrolase
MTVLRIEMLPAEEGDALWIEYGDPDAPRRLLIDGGTMDTHPALREKITGIKGKRRFELMAVTHIDNDHIDAMVKLMDEDLKVQVGDFWFNAWEQIKEDRLGPKQGEMLTERIRQRGWKHHDKSDGGPIGIPSDPKQKLATYKFTGGMKVTVLGPRIEDLRRLRKEWKKIIENAGLEPGGEFTGAKLLEKAPKYAKDRLGTQPPNVERWANRKFKEDGSPSNASSISLLLEYGNRKVLLTGDALGSTLVEGIDRLLKERKLKRLKIDAFKLPHHGSKNNLNNEVMERLDCKHFLVSSSGRKFHHPDDDAIARILFHSDAPVLHFNYLSDDNKDWDRSNWKKKLGYQTDYPVAGRSGLVVEFQVKL